MHSFNNEDFWVTPTDMHACPYGGGYGYCHSGVRPFFKKHGLDWQEFLFGKGVRASSLLKTKNVLAIKVVEFARERRKNNETR